MLVISNIRANRVPEPIPCEVAWIRPSGQFEKTRMRVNVTLVEREMLGAIECLEKGDCEKRGGEETNEKL
jgi:hypothetical protein